MKHTPAERENIEHATADSRQPCGAPDYVTAYSFILWDHDRGATITYPRMATPAAIARMRGKVNEDSAWIVNASELDIEGFYSGS